MSYQDHFIVRLLKFVLGIALMGICIPLAILQAVVFFFMDQYSSEVKQEQKQFQGQFQQ